MSLAICKICNQSYKECNDFSKHEKNCYVVEINCVELCLFVMMYMTTFLGHSQFSQMFPSMKKGEIVGNMVRQMIYELSFMATYDLHFSYDMIDRKFSKC